jgi:hypothetical protein
MADSKVKTSREIRWFRAIQSIKQADEYAGIIEELELRVVGLNRDLGIVNPESPVAIARLQAELGTYLRLLEEFRRAEELLSRLTTSEPTYKTPKDRIIPPSK